MIDENKFYFSLFAPEAQDVLLFIFQELESDESQQFLLNQTKKDFWDITIENNLEGLFYSYKIVPKNFDGQISDLPMLLDPYAKCVCTFTTYKNPRMAKILNKPYKWKNNDFVPPEAEDLIIYETHLRDLTIHPSSNTSSKGTYKGFIDPKSIGGLNYIKSLGVNAVEFLPLMEYGYLELPFNKKCGSITNTWNRYERNHWGYMTANFFSPAAYYTISNNSIPKNKWIGNSGKQVNDFKSVVDELHQNNIAVIMDVVYNHLSEYETGNLKEIARNYYLRTDEKGYLLSDSYCGNDLKTENYYVRKLVLDSLKFWMTEYKIDGFRFDLGNIIDDGTLQLIVKETRALNPNVILIAEPWGGGYAPTKFSDFGYASWNDRYRNGVKGENPEYGLGWLFGKWYSNNNKHSIENFIKGTTIDGHNGLFNEHYHSVNYLESHDGYTLGDFIRIAIDDTLPNEQISDIDEHIKVTPSQLKFNKLAAMFLFVSKGITMIHSGQEFARSKVIFRDSKINDPNQGKLDHNSYEKDNPTNWINFEHSKANKELVNYYKGLINFRKKYSLIRSAEHHSYTFYDIMYTNLAFAFKVEDNEDEIFVALNADTTLTAHFDLPNGDWNIIADPIRAGIKNIGSVSKTLSVPPTSGFILVKNLIK